MSDLVKQFQDQIKGLQAQLEAAKQAFNEQLNANHQLRTQCILFQQQMQEDAAEKKRLDDNVKSLTQKILELTPPKQEEKLEPIPESQL